LNIKVLARKGISEVLEFLGTEGSSVLGEELRDKTGITHKNLKVLVDRGVLEKGEERVLVRTIPIRRRISTYSISDKGRRILEICENLTEDEAKEFLRVSQRQLSVLRKILNEGPKRARDFPEIDGGQAYEDG